MMLRTLELQLQLQVIFDSIEFPEKNAALPEDPYRSEGVLWIFGTGYLGYTAQI